MGVFVSSDRSVEAFNEYYGKMPWLAIPSDTGAAGIKNRLAQTLKISGIPTLIVLDAKTGDFVTDGARNEVSGGAESKEKSQELVKTWKEKESVPLNEAALGGQQPTQNPIVRLIFTVLKNPMY